MGDCGRHFDSVEENSFLPLENYVLGPLHEPGEVAFREYVVAQSEVTWSLFEERVGFLLYLLGSFLSFLSFGLSLCMLTIIATIK